MKKLLLTLTIIFLAAGCSVLASGTSPTRVAEDFFGKYQSLDNKVITQLNDVVSNQSLSTTQSNGYKDMMKNQYKNLTYTVKDEKIDGNKAVVTTEVEVYNLAKEQAAIDAYVAANRNKFTDTKGNIDNNKYMDYKVEQLKKVNDRIKYTIDLNMTKVNNEWQLDNITDAIRQKINGMYNTV
jgi:nitrogenase molybdenum-iron protein alpha/beta subunit